MFSMIRKRSKYFAGLMIAFLGIVPSAMAGGPPEPSIFSNILAITLITLMILLLIIIGILASILIGAADVKLKKTIELRKSAVKTGITVLLLLGSLTSMAQDTATSPGTAAATIGGLAASTFYIMATVIFLELLIIIAMLINIRFLLKAETKKITEAVVETVKKPVKPVVNWWSKINKFKPVSEEAELDLGHEYDGIRELNNKLPPWWLYGFYLTIVFAGVYLWRFHVSHEGPSSIKEYQIAVLDAERKTEEYLKKKGDAVDENTVTYLSAEGDLAEGKNIYMKSCVACHTETGAGNIGPNLTDDFWLHGNDMKSIFKTIRYGINAMPQWQNAYSNKQMAQVASYVKSLHGTNPPNGKAPQGIEMKEEAMKPVTDTLQAKK